MFWIIFACVVALFVIVIARSDPLPVCGIYRQPGKWYYVKYWIFYMLVTRRKRSTKNRPEVLTGKDAGYGTKSRSSEKEMDCVQNLSLEHPLVRYRHNIVTFLRLFTVSAAVFKLGSADQRGSATGSHGVRERIPKNVCTVFNNLRPICFQICTHKSVTQSQCIAWKCCRGLARQAFC